MEQHFEPGEKIRALYITGISPRLSKIKDSSELNYLLDNELPRSVNNYVNFTDQITILLYQNTNLVKNISHIGL